MSKSLKEKITSINISIFFGGFIFIPTKKYREQYGYTVFDGISDVEIFPVPPDFFWKSSYGCSYWSWEIYKNTEWSSLYAFFALLQQPHRDFLGEYGGMVKASDRLEK